MCVSWGGVGVNTLSTYPILLPHRWIATSLPPLIYCCCVWYCVQLYACDLVTCFELVQSNFQLVWFVLMPPPPPPPSSPQQHHTVTLHNIFSSRPSYYFEFSSVLLYIHRDRTDYKVNMVLNVHRNHNLGLLGTGRRGEGGMEVGEEGYYIPIGTLSPPEWFLH